MATVEKAPWHDLQVMIQDLHKDLAFRGLDYRKRQHRTRRPCDACGDRYEVWGTEIPLYPYCGHRRCKRRN